MKIKSYIIFLFITMTSCSSPGEKLYIETCMTELLANPLNIISSLFGAGIDLNQSRNFCACGYKEATKKLNFIEKFKINFLDIGISDPLSSKFMELSMNANKTCKYILDETEKQSTNSTQDSDNFSSQEEEATTTEINQLPRNSNKNESIFSKHFQQEAPKPLNQQQEAPKPLNQYEQKELVEQGSEEILDNYKKIIGNAISQKKKYPRIAQMRGWQGEVLINIEIDSNGNLIKTEILEGSEYKVLDNAALDMVSEAAPFERLPKHFQDQNLSIQIPITFSLN